MFLKSIITLDPLADLVLSFDSTAAHGLHLFQAVHGLGFSWLHVFAIVSGCAWPWFVLASCGADLTPILEAKTNRQAGNHISKQVYKHAGWQTDIV